MPADSTQMVTRNQAKKAQEAQAQAQAQEEEREVREAASILCCMCQEDRANGIARVQQQQEGRGVSVTTDTATEDVPSANEEGGEASVAEEECNMACEMPSEEAANGTGASGPKAVDAKGTGQCGFGFVNETIESFRKREQKGTP
jgi:hypothetical protein